MKRDKGRVIISFAIFKLLWYEFECEILFLIKFFSLFLYQTYHVLLLYYCCKIVFKAAPTKQVAFQGLLFLLLRNREKTNTSFKVSLWHTCSRKKHFWREIQKHLRMRVIILFTNTEITIGNTVAKNNFFSFFLIFSLIFSW